MLSTCWIGAAAAAAKMSCLFLTHSRLFSSISFWGRFYSVCVCLHSENPPEKKNLEKDHIFSFLFLWRLQQHSWWMWEIAHLFLSLIFFSYIFLHCPSSASLWINTQKTFRSGSGTDVLCCVSLPKGCFYFYDVYIHVDYGPVYTVNITYFSVYSFFFCAQLYRRLFSSRVFSFFWNWCRRRLAPGKGLFG